MLPNTAGCGTHSISKGEVPKTFHVPNYLVNSQNVNTNSILLSVPKEQIEVTAFLISTHTRLRKPVMRKHSTSSTTPQFEGGVYHYDIIKSHGYIGK